jgi:hypothetical protein
MIEHVKDYHTADMDPWDFEFRGKQTEQEKSRQFKQARTGYTSVLSPFSVSSFAAHPPLIPVPTTMASNV